MNSKVKLTKRLNEMTRKDAEDVLRVMPVFVVLLCALFGIHYLKPDWYWDGWTHKLFRRLLGDTITDIIGYAGYCGLGVFLMKMWLKAQELHSAESARVNGDDNQTGT